MPETALYKLSRILMTSDLAGYREQFTPDAIIWFDGALTTVEESRAQTAVHAPAEVATFTPSWRRNDTEGGRMFVKYPAMEMEAWYTVEYQAEKIDILVVNQTTYRIDGTIRSLGVINRNGKDYHRIDIVRAGSGNIMRVLYLVGMPAHMLRKNQKIRVSSYQIDGAQGNHTANQIYATRIESK